MSSLAEEYPRSLKRTRDLLAQYREIGAPGAFGAAMIEDVLRRADEASASGDVIAMLRCHEEMLALK